MNGNDAFALLGHLLRGIAPDAEIDDVDRQAPMQDVLDLDSMDFLNLLTALHEATGIDVPERDYRLLSTIDGFVGYVMAATEAA